MPFCSMGRTDVTRLIRRAAILLAVVTLTAAATTIPAAPPADKQEPPGDAGNRRFLIIHSDDAGMSHSVNSATIQGMTEGCVSSCSIMVPCPWFTEFAEFARKNPQLDYGIHLTLNSEFSVYRWPPVADRSIVPTLVDESGFLHRSKQDVVSKARPAEVEIELRAQIDRALKAGIPLSHLDTHMGTVISTADFLDIYVRLGIEYNLPVMLIRNPDPLVGREYPDLMRQSKAFVREMESRQLPVIDHLYQFYEGRDHEARKERYLSTFRNLKPGVTQMIIHCGTDDAELKAITGSHFLRGDDTRIFTDPDVAKQINEMGIEVISWKQLREMQFPSAETR